MIFPLAPHASCSCNHETAQNSLVYTYLHPQTKEQFLSSIGLKKLEDSLHKNQLRINCSASHTLWFCIPDVQQRALSTEVLSSAAGKMWIPLCTQEEAEAYFILFCVCFHQRNIVAGRSDIHEPKQAWLMLECCVQFWAFWAFWLSLLEVMHCFHFHSEYQPSFVVFSH